MTGRVSKKGSSNAGRGLKTFSRRKDFTKKVIGASDLKSGEKEGEKSEKGYVEKKVYYSLQVLAGSRREKEGRHTGQDPAFISTGGGGGGNREA